MSINSSIKSIFIDFIKYVKSCEVLVSEEDSEIMEECKVFISKKEFEFRLVGSVKKII